MKKFFLICMVLLAFGMPVCAVSKLNPEVHHFFFVDGAAGYATLLNMSSNETSGVIKSGPGATGMVGIGYRLAYNHFLFSFGVEGQYAYYTNSITDAKLDLRMVDTEDDAFIMHAKVEDCADVCRIGNVGVPILFGGEWGALYFLAGAKVVYNFYGKTSSSAYLTTTGQYERFIGDFEDMPGHEFYSGQKISSGEFDCPLNLNVLAHIEFGGRVGDYSLLSGANVPHPLHRWYVGAYLDCGVLNVHKNTGSNNPILRHTGGETGSDPLTFYVTPAMLSTNLQDAFISNLSVGVKVTYLLEGRDPMWGVAYNQKANTYTRKGKEWNLPSRVKKSSYTGSGQLYQPKKLKPYQNGTRLYEQKRVKNTSNKKGRIAKEK